MDKAKKFVFKYAMITVSTLIMVVKSDRSHVVL